LSYWLKEKVYSLDEIRQSDKVRLNSTSLSDIEIAEEVSLWGKKCIFKHDGSDKINYKVLHFDNFYAFHFENSSKSGVLKSKFNFKLNNLEIIDDDSPATPSDDGSMEWNVLLNPGEKKLMKMKIVNPDSDTSYSTEYSYRIA